MSRTTRCLQCGGPMPEGRHPSAKVCSDECKKLRKSAQSAERYAKNKERHKAIGKAWRDRNAEYLRSYRHEWYKENKETQDARNRECKSRRGPAEERAYRKAYYEANKERALEQSRKWREDNHDRYLESTRKYREDNRDRLREYRKTWEEDNADKIRKQNADWKVANRDKVSSYQQKRRAIQREAYIEHVDHMTVYERDNWICHICGEGIDPQASGEDVMKASLDHVIPLAGGGEHSYANCKAAHLSCNASKGARIL